MSTPALPSEAQIAALVKPLVQYGRSLLGHYAVFAALFNGPGAHGTALRVLEGAIGAVVVLVDHYAPSGAASPK
ncbi:MAG: hypothetical protein M0Z69_12355 [Actinomycetota bacterium]|nr:hypothetical protein [Actinomycetota bacterium]